MPHHTQKPRSPRVQQLKRPEDTKYTSFKELGVLSPKREDFDEEDDGNREETGSNKETADQDGKAEGSGRRENEIMKEEEGTRQRSGSMRLMEWFVRPKLSSSPP